MRVTKTKLKLPFHQYATIALICVTFLGAYITFTVLRDDVIPEPSSTNKQVYHHDRSMKGIGWTYLNKTPNIPTLSMSKDVLLFAYMRSGSTMMGQFFRNSPGTFYVFEPLAAILPYHYLTENEVCNMRDTICQPLETAKWVRNKTRFQDALTTIQNLYSCNIRDIPTPVIDKILENPTKSGNAWVEFEKCLNSSQNESPRNKETCFDQIELACKNADIKVLKVLRLGFTHMRRFLDNIPNLNVLFLQRDPRAILNSRIYTTWFPVSGGSSSEPTDNADSLCKKMQGDIDSYEDILPRYKNRILKINVEAITESEESMMNILYRFRHNYKAQQEDVDFIDKVFIKKRNNTLFRNWRETLKGDFKLYTEKRCASVLSYLSNQS